MRGRGPFSNMTGVLIKGGHLDTEMDMEGRQHEDLQSDCHVTGVHL